LGSATYRGYALIIRIQHILDLSELLKCDPLIEELDRFLDMTTIDDSNALSQPIE